MNSVRIAGIQPSTTPRAAPWRPCAGRVERRIRPGAARRCPEARHGRTGDARLKRTEAEWSYRHSRRAKVSGLISIYAREGATLAGYDKVRLRGVDGHSVATGGSRRSRVRGSSRATSPASRTAWRRSCATSSAASSPAAVMRWPTGRAPACWSSTRRSSTSTSMPRRHGRLAGPAPRCRWAR